MKNSQKDKVVTVEPTKEAKQEITANGKSISAGVKFANEYLAKHPEVRAHFLRVVDPI